MKRLKYFLIGAVIGIVSAGCAHMMVTPREASVACDGKLKHYNHTLKKFECQIQEGNR